MIYKLASAATEEVIAPDGEVVEIRVASNALIKLNGPVMPVNISPTAKIATKLQAHDKQVKAISCKALIDTGASMSVISPKVAEQLGLLEIGVNTIVSVHSAEERPLYFGRITFPWGGAMEIPLVSCAIEGFDCLIGRDVLRFWHMTYDGFNGEITICD